MSGGVPTRLHAQYLPQGKEKLLLRHPLPQKKKLFTPRQHFTQTELHEANIMVESPSKINELQLTPSLKLVKVLSQMTPTWN